MTRRGLTVTLLVIAAGLFGIGYLWNRYTGVVEISRFETPAGTVYIFVDQRNIIDRHALYYQVGSQVFNENVAIPIGACPGLSSELQFAIDTYPEEQLYAIYEKRHPLLVNIAFDGKMERWWPVRDGVLPSKEAAELTSKVEARLRTASKKPRLTLCRVHELLPE